MEFPDGSDPSEHQFPPGSELQRGSEQLDSGTVVIHTSNLIATELNSSKETALNFNILNSVFGQISEQ